MDRFRRGLRIGWIRAATDQIAAINPVERQLGLLKAAFGAESV
jgi:hypothetical protein